MTREALEIMLRIWTEDEPWEHRGKYWNANGIAPMFEGLMRRHIKPYQKPHPPIGVTGFSAGSETLKLAGERGYIPMSLDLNTEYVATHWDAVEEGALRSRRTRIAAIGGWCGRCWWPRPMSRRSGMPWTARWDAPCVSMCCRRFGCSA